MNSLQTSYQAVKPTQTSATKCGNGRTAWNLKTSTKFKKAQLKQVGSIFNRTLLPYTKFQSCRPLIWGLRAHKVFRSFDSKIHLCTYIFTIRMRSLKNWLTSKRRTCHLQVMVSLRTLVSFSHQLNGGADVPLKIYSIQWDPVISFQSR